ncbi:MAG: sugar phosphate isomerase/epimerase [Flavobacteriaceae bacterium]|jgi:sugar phosphate isomerase/epimerase
MIDRRTFIKNSAVISSGVLAIPSCLSVSSKKEYEIGVQLYTVRDQMGKDPEGTLSKIADMGYKEIESAGYQSGKMYGFAGKEFQTILSDLGLKNVSAHIPLNVFTNDFEEALEYMAESGGQYAVLPWLSADDRQSIDQYKSYAELLNRSGEKAKTYGVEICYHNHDFEFIEIDGELPMKVILEGTDPDLVKMELDIYWINKAGLDAEEFFKQNRKRVPLWHVKDMDATPEKGFTEVGEGVIDYVSIFEKKELSGMKHFFVEQDVSVDPMKSIETSYKNLTQKILN